MVCMSWWQELHTQAERPISINICHQWPWVAAGALCSQGCWANSCCETLFLFVMIWGSEWQSGLHPSAELLVQLQGVLVMKYPFALGLWLKYLLELRFYAAIACKHLIYKKWYWVYRGQWNYFQWALMDNMLMIVCFCILVVEIQNGNECLALKLCWKNQTCKCMRFPVQNWHFWYFHCMYNPLGCWGSLQALEVVFSMPGWQQKAAIELWSLGFVLNGAWLLLCRMLFLLRRSFTQGQFQKNG